MKAYLIVETAYCSDFGQFDSEKRLRAVTIDEKSAEEIKERLENLELDKRVNEPTSTYCIEEADLDVVVDILL